MSAYAPRAGSLVERAVEILKAGPLRGMDLAKQLGIGANAVGPTLESAIAHGVIVKDSIAAAGGAKGNRSGALYLLPSSDEVDDQPPVQRVVPGTRGVPRPSAAAIAAANPFGPIAATHDEPPRPSTSHEPPRSDRSSSVGRSVSKEPSSSGSTTRSAASARRP